MIPCTSSCQRLVSAFSRASLVSCRASACLSTSTTTHAAKERLPKRMPNHGKLYEDHESLLKARQMIKVPWKYEFRDTTEPHWKFGRHVPQLKRLRFKYGLGGASRNLNQYLETHFAAFEAAHPETAMYVEKKLDHEDPCIIAYYCGDRIEKIEVSGRGMMKMTVEEIMEQVEEMRRRGGRDWANERLAKYQMTERPSMQGTWTPRMFQPVIDANNLREQGAEYVLPSERRRRRVSRKRKEMLEAKSRQEAEEEVEAQSPNPEDEAADSVTEAAANSGDNEPPLEQTASEPLERSDKHA